MPPTPWLNPHSMAPNPRIGPDGTEVAATVEESGLATTAGVCNQTDPEFSVNLLSQPRPVSSPSTSPSVAVVVSCPVELGRLFNVNRVVAASVEPVG